VLLLLLLLLLLPAQVRDAGNLLTRTVTAVLKMQGSCAAAAAAVLRCVTQATC
jgi:hypothetical protein